MPEHQYACQTVTVHHYPDGCVELAALFELHGEDFQLHVKLPTGTTLHDAVDVFHTWADAVSRGEWDWSPDTRDLYSPPGQQELPFRGTGASR